jgi:hypothetical protein
MSGTVSDNTVFQVAARYTIDPWRFYGGYRGYSSQSYVIYHMSNII